jgi:hypothetical protein
MKSKRAWAVLIAISLKTIPLVSGQAIPPSVGLDVKSLTNGAAVHTFNSGVVTDVRDPINTRVVHTDQGSTSRSRSTSANLEVSVHNFRAAQQPVVVRTYFIGKTESGAEGFYLLNQLDTPLGLPPSGDAKTTVSSGHFGSVTTRSHSIVSKSDSPNTTAANSNVSEGRKLVGWIVQVLVDGKPIASRASNLTLEAATRDPSKLATIVNAR